MLTRKQRFLSFAFRIKWYVTGRRCWPHNETCLYCSDFGFCHFKQPSLLRIEGTWCCGTYVPSIEKMFRKYVTGKTIVIAVDRVETMSPKEEKSDEVL